MISKSDLVLLLSDLGESDAETAAAIRKVYATPGIPLDILKYINSKRQLDLTAFYNKIRKSYNQKKSKLYVSIVKDSLEADKLIVTLSAYSLQVALYASKLEDSSMFLQHARAREVSLALAKYYTDYDLTNCSALLRLIRADLMACEVVEGRREP